VLCLGVIRGLWVVRYGRTSGVNYECSVIVSDKCSMSSKL
jgi:hypothetical protein